MKLNWNCHKNQSHLSTFNTYYTLDIFFLQLKVTIPHQSFARCHIHNRQASINTNLIACPFKSLHLSILTESQSTSIQHLYHQTEKKLKIFEQKMKKAGRTGTCFAPFHLGNNLHVPHKQHWYPYLKSLPQLHLSYTVLV